MTPPIVTLLTEYILPLAVTISAAATTTTAVIAVKLLRAVRTHERALFGEEPIEGDDGIICAVNQNTERSEENRIALKASDDVDLDVVE